MTLDPPDKFKDYMRLCFAWLTDEQIVEVSNISRNNLHRNDSACCLALSQCILQRHISSYEDTAVINYPSKPAGWMLFY